MFLSNFQNSSKSVDFMNFSLEQSGKPISCVDQQQLYNNDFIECDLLKLDEQEPKEEEKQQQQNLLNDKKIQELQSGIQSMKKLMNQYEQQLKEIELLKDQQKPSQLNSYITDSYDQISQSQQQHQYQSQQEEAEEEQKINQIQIQKKPIQKTKKPFKCHHLKCSFESIKKVELTRHIKKCHQQQKHACRFCKEKFHLQEEKIKHEQVNHKVKIVKVSTFEEISQYQQVQNKQQKEDNNNNDNDNKEKQFDEKNNQLEQDFFSGYKTQVNSLSHISKDDLFDFNEDFEFSF